MLKVTHSTGYTKDDCRGGILSQTEINALFRVASNSLSGVRCLRLPQIYGDYTLTADENGTLVQLVLVNPVLGTVASDWTAVAEGVFTVSIPTLFEASFYSDTGTTTPGGIMSVSTVTQWFGPIGGAYSPLTDRAAGATRYASFYVTSDVDDLVELSANGFEIYDAGDGAYNVPADDPGSVSWASVISDVVLTENTPRLFWAKHVYNASDVGITETAISIVGESGVALLNGIRIAEDGQSGYKVYHATTGTTGGTLIEGTGEILVVGNSGGVAVNGGIYDSISGVKIETVDVSAFSDGDGPTVLTSATWQPDGECIYVLGQTVNSNYGNGFLVLRSDMSTPFVCFDAQLSHKTRYIDVAKDGQTALDYPYINGSTALAHAVGIADENDIAVFKSVPYDPVFASGADLFPDFQCGDGLIGAPSNYVEWSPDASKILVATGAQGNALVFDGADGTYIKTLEDGGGTDNCACASWSPDGSKVVTAHDDGYVRVFDYATEALDLDINAHTDVIRRARFNNDGTLICSCSNDFTAKVWNASTGALVHTVTHTAAVRDVEFSPDGAYLMSAANGENLIVTRVSDWTAITTIADMPDEVRAARWNPTRFDVITTKQLPIRLPLALPGSGTETHLYRVTRRNRWGIESPNQYLAYRIVLDENGDLTAPPPPETIILTPNDNGTISVTVVSGAFRSENIEDYRWKVTDGTTTETKTIIPRPGFSETYQAVWGPYDWDAEITISASIIDGRNRESDPLSDTVTITSTAPSLPSQYALTSETYGQRIAVIEPYQDGQNWIDGGFGTAGLYVAGEPVLEVDILADGEFINVRDYELVNGTVTGVGDAPFVVDSGVVYLCADGARVVEIDPVARTITASDFVNDTTIACPSPAVYDTDTEGNVYWQIMSPVSNGWKTFMKVGADGVLYLGFGIKQEDEPEGT